ncbi:unnamed protein product [Durusdinium trenchii]|uniref:Uncharacterized protein n=1 Tax=Durusdinium trenchii TaxID=1381693 RepID=A0ABP0QXH8_9DINO
MVVATALSRGRFRPDAFAFASALAFALAFAPVWPGNVSWRPSSSSWAEKERPVLAPYGEIQSEQSLSGTQHLRCKGGGKSSQLVAKTNNTKESFQHPGSWHRREEGFQAVLPEASGSAISASPWAGDGPWQVK